MKKLLFMLIIFIVFQGCKNQFEEKFNEAKVEYSKENFQGAINLTDSIQGCKNQKTEILFLRGKCFFFNGQLNDAEKAFKKIIRIQPDYYEAKIWLIRIYILLSENQKAQSIINSEKKNNSTDWRIFYYESMIARADNELQKEIYCLQKSREYSEQSYKVYKRLKEIWKNAGLNKESLEYGELEKLLNK